MKNENVQLQIQAYLDGELTGAEARQIEQLLAADASASQLRNELASLRAALRGNEPVVKLPVPHELYWSQIERAIEKAETDPAPPAADWGFLLHKWLRRYFAPAAAVAAVAILVLGISRFVTENPAQHYVEIVNYSTDVNVSSFRAASENMFVVWISPKEILSAEDPGEDLLPGEELYQ